MTSRSGIIDTSTSNLECLNCPKNPHVLRLIVRAFDRAIIQHELQTSQEPVQIGENSRGDEEELVEIISFKTNDFIKTIRKCN
jgi:hypothetical protein